MSGFADVVTALDALAAKLDEGRRDTVDTSDFRDLLTLVMKQQHTISELHHRAENTFRWGTVGKVDAKEGYEVTFGTDADGKPLPSAWIPHPEQGGKFKTWRPSTEGQIVGVLCPNGDQRQAIMFPKGGFSDENKPPSDKLDENVETYGKVKTTWKADSTAKQVGDKVSVTTTTASHTATTEKAKHDVGPKVVTTTAEGSKHVVDGQKVLADAGLFRATRKVILASG